MTVMDTTDGLFMNLAYGWAFFNPVRKVYYNLAITGLSVAICFVIGGVEALSLVPQEIHGLSRTSGFWGLISRFNINSAGFVIVAMFIATWLAALLIWRYARIEEKWSPATHDAGPLHVLPAPPPVAGRERPAHSVLHHDRQRSLSRCGNLEMIEVEGRELSSGRREPRWAFSAARR
jgi:high-affinity nickel-transport protein